MNSTSEFSSLHGYRRSNIDILFDIVSIAINGKSKFEILEKAHLNSQQLDRYLEELNDLGLIEVKKVSGRNFYIASRKGKQLLRQYENLKKFLM